MPIARKTPKKAKRVSAAVMKRRENVAITVGKIMSDAVFRDSFEKNPTSTLKAAGLSLAKTDKAKVINVAKRLKAGKLGGSGTEPALHCEIMSSVGYA